MQFAYNLLSVDKPMFGGLVFPRAVVDDAVKKAYVPGMFTTHGLLELCRYERDDLAIIDYYPGGERVESRNSNGHTLEVIGHVTELSVLDGDLWCYGGMIDGLKWDDPLTDHAAIPYLDMTVEKRVVRAFTITEVVLVYQAVTRLALRKFSEKKSILCVDNMRPRA